MNEQLIAEGPMPIAAATRSLPGHPKTWARIAQKGTKQPDGSVVRLEVVRIGNRLMTTTQAVARYIARLNGPAGVAVVVPRSPSERSKASAAAEERLKKAGC